ncbi:MAG: hypothetical protein Q9221_005805 [Calogaya cf. arnoldii]
MNWVHPTAYLTQPRKKRQFLIMIELSRMMMTPGSQVPEPHKNSESSYILSVAMLLQPGSIASTFSGSWTRWCLHPSVQAPLYPSSLPCPSFGTPIVTSSTQQLNPLAAHPDTFRIAVLATGTGIWAVDISQDFPLAQIDCFDIDLQQCPPSQWLPHNVKAHHWDIYTDLTSELEGLYDVVYMCLLLVVIRDNDPRPILNSALRMLKKGG